MPDEEPSLGVYRSVTGYFSRTFDSWLENRTHSNRLIIAALILVSLPFIGIGIAATRAVMPYDRIVRALDLRAALFSGSSDAPVHYECARGKTITATFHTVSVDLTLSDDRSLTLTRTISASGARFANADGSFVFWAKGDGAFIDEHGVETYTGCTTKQ